MFAGLWRRRSAWRRPATACHVACASTLLVGAATLLPADLLIASGTPVLQSASLPPAPARYANDPAGVVDAQRLAALEENLARFERETANKVVVYVSRRLPAGTK